MTPSRVSWLVQEYLPGPSGGSGAALGWSPSQCSLQVIQDIVQSLMSKARIKSVAKLSSRSVIISIDLALSGCMLNSWFEMLLFWFMFLIDGVYMPQWYTSPIHCSPQDSILLFEDIKEACEKSALTRWFYLYQTKLFTVGLMLMHDPQTSREKIKNCSALKTTKIKIPAAPVDIEKNSS